MTWESRRDTNSLTYCNTEGIVGSRLDPPGGCMAWAVRDIFAKNMTKGVLAMPRLSHAIRTDTTGRPSSRTPGGNEAGPKQVHKPADCRNSH